MSVRDLHLDLLELVVENRKVLFTIGDLLLRLRQGEKYLKAVGSGVDSWSDYLSQPEIGMSVAEANNLINVYKLVCTYPIPEEDYLQIPLATLKEMVRQDTQSEELIETAKNLSTRDFKDRYFEATHDEEPSKDFVYMIMKRSLDTGNLKKVHGIESTDILNVFKDQIAE